MDYFRRFLQGVKVAPSDEELGRRASVYPNEPRQSMQITDEAQNAIVENTEKLMEFRLLIGITTHPSFKAPRGFNTNSRPIVTTSGRPAPNKGIYATVVDNEIKCKKNFKLFSGLINFALGLQIIVAAALTALGASNGSHKAVTVFGAVNTVIAGFLTFLKGSGLPNRLKFYQHEWSRVRDYIEQRERDLSASHHDIDVHEQVDIIRAMYEEIKADLDANTPDRFVSSGAMRRAQAVANPAPPLATGHQHGSSMLSKSKMEATFGVSEKELFGKHADSEGGLIPVEEVKRLKSKVEDKMREIAQLEREMEAQRRKAVKVEGEVEKMVTEGINPNVIFHGRSKEDRV